MRPDRPGPGEKRRQQRVLCRRQMNRPAALPDQPGRSVDLDVPEFVKLWCSGPFFGSTQQSPSPRHELGHAERLRDVIVRAGVEKPNLFALLLPDRQDQDRNARGLPNVFHQGQAIRRRHAQVRDHEVEGVAIENPGCLLAFGGGFDTVPGPLECVPDHLADPRLVVDQQHATHIIVGGSSTSKTVPPPVAPASRTLPPLISTRLRAIERPNPVPGTSEAEGRRTNRSSTLSRSDGGIPAP